MNILYSKSGSDGNCHCITDGETTIIIECGIKLTEVNKRIDYKLSDVSAALVSHSHQDHAKYVNDFLKRAIPCFMSKQTKEELELSGYYARIVEHKKIFKIGTFMIFPFELPHQNSDGTDCYNLGYLIYSKKTKERLLFCTDCQYIPYVFQPCEYYLLESNYDSLSSELFNTEDKMCYVNKRRFRSHLSSDNCMLFLEKQDLSKCKQIHLIHLSKNYSQPKENLKNKFYSKFKKEVVING